jgi:hypothetical protein
LSLLSFLLVSHILFPVFNSLLQPFFHESSISLKFVNLRSSNLLLVGLTHVPFLIHVLFSFISLSFCLIIRLLEVVFHVHLLLRFV